MRLKIVASALHKHSPYLLSFVETPRKFIIAELSIRKIGSSSVLITSVHNNIISTDEDPSLRIESSAIINLRGVSTKLKKYIVFTMQTYKKLITFTLLHVYCCVPKRRNSRRQWQGYMPGIYSLGLAFRTKK